MLTIYRRHKKACGHRDKGRRYRGCRCPIWVDGLLVGKEIRKSLDLRDWQKAQERVREWEAKESIETERKPEPVTVEQASKEFLSDAEARGLRASTLYKYRLLFEQIKAFASDVGSRFLKEFDLAMLRRFRATWPNRNFSARKKLECLRAFFRFAQAAGWIPDNPTLKLESPKVSQPPVLPFTREEWIWILAACDVYKDNYGRTGRDNARRLRAFVLLLRYSGLRIGDVVALSRDRIADGKLFLYTAKTGTPVYCPLPPFVVTALEAAPRTSEKHFFWTGVSNLKSAVGDWQRSLGKLFELAQVPDGHAHRFRHTFAVELLLAGVPMERVSVLLGHSSMRVTERHYAAWVKARQEQLEADVRRTWTVSPGAFEGTREVHGGSALVQ
jgi:integrase